MGTGDPIEESKCKCYSKKENKTEETNKKNMQRYNSRNILEIK